MKHETTLVHVFGGPERIVQHVRTGPKTIAVCPLCKARLKGGDATILVELVKSLPFAHGDRRYPEFAVRIHLCARCAEPVVRQKREAMDEFRSLFAELVAKEMLRELGREGLAEPNEKKSELRQRKRPSPKGGTQRRIHHSRAR